MTTFVRPADADLAAMDNRSRSLLTDEGAKSWYPTDVTTLLQEVRYLRSERASAVASFAQHMPVKPTDDEPLPSIAERWKETASGFWEKSRTRKLQEQIENLGATAAALAVSESALEARLSELVSAQEQENARWLSKELALQHAIRDHAEALAQETQAKNDLIARLAQLDKELADERSASTGALLAATMLADQDKERARTLLQQALEVLS